MDDDWLGSKSTMRVIVVLRMAIDVYPTGEGSREHQHKS